MKKAPITPVLFPSIKHGGLKISKFLRLGGQIDI